MPAKKASPKLTQHEAHMVKLMKEATSLLVKWHFREPVKIKPSATAKEISSILAKYHHQGVSHKTLNCIREITQVLIDEPITPISPQTGHRPRAGTLVVPLENPNGHDYPLEKPFLVLSTASSGSHLTILGRHGNTPPNMMYGQSRPMRPATDKEIDTYIKKVGMVRIRTLIRAETIQGTINDYKHLLEREGLA